MAAGQSAFSVAVDVAVHDALALRLAVEEAERGARHVRQLRTLLQLHAVDSAAGMGICTVANAALVLGASETRVGALLDEALLLGALPGGLEAVECGLLTVEQSRAVVEQLTPLPLTARLAVWERLQRLLIEQVERTVLPPARLTELLRRWVTAADSDDATDRRRRAEEQRRVDHRRRADGLHDLFAFGFTGPDLLAVASRIRARSAPVGPDDDRTADQRRFDALKDLLLGRDPLPLHDPHDPTESAPARCGSGGGRAICGCWPGSPVPCGAELLVHVPLGAALDTTDEVAELVGHGTIEPDLLRDLLLASPRLRVVWTDQDGVPVAVGDKAVIPRRGDSAAVRQALDDLLARPPESLHPRHPFDHGPGAPPATHPPGQAGPYRVPRRLRRLIEVRSPRCEWPGCGARAVRCDAEHDVPWPDGPTCACNLGPCCRRHHRIKQQGWTKTRHSGSTVSWTSPNGGRWLSRAQHQPPAAPVRPLPPVPTPNPLDELSPGELEHVLWSLGLLLDDPQGVQLPEDADTGGADGDPLAEHLRTGDTRWTLDLDDPYRWQEQPV